ncbi:MAG: hypothetical protein A3H97_13105 [Acidobacteria bacterium RIFCSPLOWO2_02_FULL_65_29]|nr:MAG: hypothetical protein A3H97_13105 [Acidobacteria bacterium RIFCSPLOWO2_02_FULL_65_29]
MARDPYRYFRVEARELLDQLGQGVLDLEKGAAAPELVARLLRLSHTLKGAARVVKQAEIADWSHELEDTLARCRESPESLSRDLINRLLRRLDNINDRLVALAPPAPSGAVRGSAPSEESFHAVRPDVHEIDVLLDTLAEAHGQLGSLRPLLTGVERARQLADLVLGHLSSPAASDVTRPAERGLSARVRPLAEELRASVGAFERDVAYRVGQVEREFQEVRAAAERLRLVPATALFTLLERAVRDTAQAIGKRVVFEGRGADVRVDSNVLGVVQGALLQVVRNAVAHGIEAAVDRRAAGKPSEGRVALDVARRGTRIVFTCTDDGRGVDIEAVRRIVESKGLLSAPRETLGSEELLELLLRGGISTSGTVTEVSGRGIGLDVVREAAERLGGIAVLRTAAGTGTTVELDVPLTLAMFPALVVEAAGSAFVVPLDAVLASLRVAPEQIVRTGQAQSVVYDGKTVPLAPLARVVAPDRWSPRPRGPSSAVIVRGLETAAAFIVDRVRGTATAVLRPLPALAPAAPFVAGVSLDEAGVPRLVLDPEGLVAVAHRAEQGAEDVVPRRHAVLVIDDSLTTRMLEQSILESAGYDVDLAISGEEALEKARRARYSLFLVDVEMPGMDGFTFIERARVEPELRDVPAILVTSRISPADRQRGLDVGAKAYIVKSEFDQGVLLDRIQGLVG